MKRVGKIRPILIASLFLLLAFAAGKIIINSYIGKAALAFSPSDKFVKSLDALDVVDGTAPFEADDNAGNDSSDRNKIVRANDKLVYNVRPFLETLPGKTGNNTSAIHFEAKLPKQRLIFWDLETIKNSWAASATVEDDGSSYILKASYDFNSSNDSASSTSFPFYVFVSGAKNQTQITPEFKAWMEGNDPSLTADVTGPTVRISSAPRYVVELKSSNSSNDYVYVNSQLGRVKNFSVQYKMFNSADKVGLRGIEYPMNDFTGTFDFVVKKTDLNTSVVEDVTARMLPKLYNYKVNTEAIEEGAITVNNGTLTNEFSPSLPVKMPVVCAPGINCIMQSPGSFQAAESGNSVHTRLTGYGVDQNTVFPNGGVGEPVVLYDDRTGFLSVGNFFFFVPLADGNGWYQIDVEAKLSNIQTQDLSGNTVNFPNQLAHTQFNAYPDGNFANAVDLRAADGVAVITSDGEVYGGKNVALTGQEIMIRAAGLVGQYNDPDYYAKRYATVIKFDPSAIELTGNNKLFITPRYNPTFHYTEEEISPANYQSLYAIKQNGQGWASDQEMMTLTAEDLRWFNDLNTAKQHGIVVAAAMESINDSFNMAKNGVWYWGNYGARVKDGATPGVVYQFQHESYFWVPSVPQSSLMNINSGTFVKPPLNGAHAIGTPQAASIIRSLYKKTAYDQNGVQISGTHFGGFQEGNSLLVLVAKPSQVISVEKRNGKDDVNKVIFDVLKQESIATFKIVPRLEISNNFDNPNVNTSPVIKVNVPKGLEVLPESYHLFGYWDETNNTINNSVPYPDPAVTTTKNGDGSTTIEFRMGNVPLVRSVYENLVIRFQTKIPVNTKNAKSFSIKSEITVPELSQTPIESRTSAASILVANLVAQATAKEIKYPVIDLGESFEYQLTYFNNTDNSLSDVSILDILPYNNDNKGTVFNGNYTISDLQSNLGAQMFCTTDVAIRNYTAENFSSASDVTWQPCGSGDLSHITAIYSKFNLNGNASHILNYKLKPFDAQTLDRYVSNLKTYIANQTDTLNTPDVVGTIARRTISGLVWFDANADGLRQDEEQIRFSDREVSLADVNGNPVRRLDGSIVESVLTDQDGRYEFIDVPPMDGLQVHFKLKNGDIVTQQLDSDYEINSDADENGIVTGIDLPNARRILLANANSRRDYIDLGLKDFLAPLVPPTGVGANNLIYLIVALVATLLGFGLIAKLKFRRRWY